MHPLLALSGILQVVYLLFLIYVIKWCTKHYQTALSIINSEDTEILLDEISNWACKQQLKFNVQSVSVHVYYYTSHKESFTASLQIVSLEPAAISILLSVNSKVPIPVCVT